MPTRLAGGRRRFGPDEAPPLDGTWFERDGVREGERVIRPANTAGRPEPGRWSVTVGAAGEKRV